MSDLCTPTFEDLATRLGFSCEEAGGFFELRNPAAWELDDLPVLELTIVLGSVLALVYAIVRLRRHGDPTNLVLWFGATAFLFVIEPPIYFPGTFGTEEYLGTMFAHNVFTVDFLWGRLPLYIIAIYPLMATLAFELVRMLGVFRRYGVFLGAVCVGFVHHAFYEIFDQLGPQLRWWEWTLDNKVNLPFFDSVPLPSVVVFAALWPMSLALCVQFFVGRHVDGDGTSPGSNWCGALSWSASWRRSGCSFCRSRPRSSAWAATRSAASSTRPNSSPSRWSRCRCWSSSGPDCGRGPPTFRPTPTTSSASTPSCTSW